MDKYEYKIRSEEIKSLIAKSEYVDAAAIADTIDWRRVKSVMMLCTISDLYKINRRFEDARDMLLLAYDRHPGGRSIVYSLCELSVKMGEFVQAVEYYKEFVQVAPKDSGRYVLQYKLYEAQDVSLEERIAVLEELKAKDYSEKWAYELAYLYHRIGLATKCVEECDELIVWFGEGKYVLKAMELKKLHEPLTPDQQAKYNQMKGLNQPEEVAAEVPYTAPEEMAVPDTPTKELPGQDLDIQVKVMNVGQYDTINMQKELAENMKELWESPAAELAQSEKKNFHMEAASETAAFQAAAAEGAAVPDETIVWEKVTDASPKEQNAEEQKMDPVTQAIVAPLLNSDTDIIDLPDDEGEEEPVEPEETKVEEVFFGETGELDVTATQIMEEMKKESQGADAGAAAVQAEQKPAPVRSGDMTELHAEEKITKFDNMLGMEYDGQISMIMPESEQVEKQITGQICLEDVLIEWERMKKDSEQKRMEAVRQRVMEQTGAMFTEFEAAARDGLLEQLEKGNTNGLKTHDFVAEGEDTGSEIFESDVNTEIEEIEEAGELAEIEEAEEIEEAVEIREAEEPDEIEELEELEGADEAEEPDELAETEDIGDTEEIDESFETEDAEELEEPAEDGETDESEESEEIKEPEAEDESEEDEESGEIEAEDESDETDEIKEQEESENQSEESKETQVKKSEETASKNTVRAMSPEEKQLFGSYIQSKATKEQIVYAIDNISMAAYTGNVIITGEEGMDTLTLAKNLIKEVQQTDRNFSGKIAKISGDSLNHKGVGPIFEKLANGALIIQKAGKLNAETIEQMRGALEQEHSGLIVILEDTKKRMNKMLKGSQLAECFNIRIDIEALDNDTLVAFAKKYAREQEYSIDALGVLALHTCIAERQTSDHAVTISEVKEILDEAIYHANRKTLGHFFDILLAKRYDDEDMIILREKDFI